METSKTLHEQAIDCARRGFNARPNFGLFVHHTDAEREYGYDAQVEDSSQPPQLPRDMD